MITDKLTIKDHYFKTLLFLERLIPLTRIRRSFRFKIKSKYGNSVLSKRETLLQLKVKDYLKNNYVEPYLKANIDYSHLFKAKKQIKANSVIWQYWAQGIDENTPKIVKACIKSVDKYKGSYEHIIITNENMLEYIDLPNEIIELYEHRTIPPTFFSDFLRVSLLSLYGGVWIDATVLLTREIPQNVLESDFFMFERNYNLDEESKKYWTGYDFSYFGFSEDFQVMCLTSFMVAKRGNVCAVSLRDLWYLYWIEEKGVIYYYFFQIIYKILQDIDNSRYISSILLDDTLPHEIRKYLDSRCDDKLLSIIYDTCFVHKLKYIRHIYDNSLAEYIIKNS